MDIRFDGKVAIVTAGASGICEAAVRAFAAAGATVVISDLDEARGTALAAELRGGGAAAEFVRTNATLEADMAALVEGTVARHGRLDVLVNGVGGSARGDGPGRLIHEVDQAQWEGTLQLSLTSAFLGTKYAVRAMLENGGGAIVNISSRGGMHVVLNGSPAYGAAKAAILHLTRTAAVQYGKHNIRVNCVAPGLTLTPLVERSLSPEARAGMIAAFPIQRFCETTDHASAILWLASDHAAMITGHTVPVDGGYDAL